VSRRLYLINALSTLNHIFKADWDCNITKTNGNHTTQEIQMFSDSVIQCDLLSLLRPRLAPWRYQRGDRRLIAFTSTATAHCQKENIAVKNTTKSIVSGGLAAAPIVSGDDELVSDVLEHIVDILLGGVKDRDTIVRWSSAKGLGRICQPLNKKLFFTDH
jgi:hypothetical protein